LSSASCKLKALDWIELLDHREEEIMIPSHNLVKLRAVLAVSILTAIFLGACNLPLSLPVEGETPAGSGADAGEGRSGENDVDPVSLICPQEGATATLTFNHDLTWGIPGTGQFRIQVNGQYQIHVIESILVHDPADKLGVYNESTHPIPVTVSAVDIRDCTDGKGSTNMRAIVSGRCYQGQLTLNIQEYYEESSVGIVCDDHDPVQIPIPVSGFEKPVTWTVPVGQIYGTVAKKKVPFVGEGADGGMNYTLSLAAMP
jgi:hypothetical protein